LSSSAGAVQIAFSIFSRLTTQSNMFNFNTQLSVECSRRGEWIYGYYYWA